MKVTIELVGDEVDDAKEMLDVFKYKAALTSIQAEVRSMWKRGNYNDDEYKIVEKIYDFINMEISDIHNEL